MLSMLYVRLTIKVIIIIMRVKNEESVRVKNYFIYFTSIIIIIIIDV